ncbi:MAG TPA: DUF6632 domain-containing protein [Candidatus Acidoferrales bacterium]|nr:DUF6632 domain-containing protein [Candidatus Acidoferrales bacterium]
MNRERALKIILVLLGLFFLAGLYPILSSVRNVSGWGGDEMMLSLYVTLGVFLLMAVRNPSAHRSLIAFTAWSSFAHASIMTYMATRMLNDRRELLIASGVLAVIGVVLIALAPAKPAGERGSAGGA